MSKELYRPTCSKQTSNPCVEKVIKAKIPGANCDSDSENTGKSTTRSTTASDEESDDDSINAADNLIANIDTFNTKIQSVNPSSLVNHVQSRSTSGLSQFAHIETDEDRTHCTAMPKSLPVLNYPQKSRTEQSNMKVVGTDGQINLDALEMWVSGSNIEIGCFAKDTSSPSSLSHSTPESTAKHLQQSDTAVKEIDAILKTISGENNLQPKQNQSSLKMAPVPSSRKQTPVERNVPASASTSSSSSSLNLDFPTPLPAIRLPPIKGGVELNNDVFHRQLTDMSLLHIPRYLPRLEHTSSTSGVDASNRLKERDKSPEHARKKSTVCRKEKYAPEILLPGQVSEVNLDELINNTVPVRTVILDYKSSKGKKNRRNTRMQRFCNLFTCCCGHTENNSNEDITVDGSIDSLNEIRFDIDVELEPEHSLPRRIWKRLKGAFGF